MHQNAEQNAPKRKAKSTKTQGKLQQTASPLQEYAVYKRA